MASDNSPVLRRIGELAEIFLFRRPMLTLAQHEELAQLLPELETVRDMDRWPKVLGQPLTFTQWATLLIHCDLYRGDPEGEGIDARMENGRLACIRPTPERQDVSTSDAAVTLMRLRFARGEGLYHPHEDRPMGLAEMLDFAIRGECGRPGRGEMVTAHWDEEEEVTLDDGQIGFGCYPAKPRVAGSVASKATGRGGKRTPRKRR